jgi:hypothetical protein
MIGFKQIEFFYHTGSNEWRVNPRRLEAGAHDLSASAV